MPCGACLEDDHPGAGDAVAVDRRVLGGERTLQRGDGGAHAAAIRALSTLTCVDSEAAIDA